MSTRFSGKASENVAEDILDQGFGGGQGTEPVGKIYEDQAVKRKKNRFSPWHFVLIPISVLFLLPFLQMFLSAFSPAAELVKFPPSFIPSRLTTEGFEKLFQTSNVWRWILNSVIVSGVAIISQTILCSLAGYGFSRIYFKGRDFSFMLIVATIMIPSQLLMIPTYVLYSKLGLVNTLAAAFVPFFSSAFGVFLMRQFFISIPKEIEEAGALDGCSKLRVFFSLVLPLAKPALATLAIFALLNSWNDLIWPLIAINDPDLFTIQLGIANFQGARRIEWGPLMAANVIATIPLVLFFMFAQKHFIATMTMTGIKD